MSLQLSSSAVQVTVILLSSVPAAIILTSPGISHLLHSLQLLSHPIQAAVILYRPCSCHPLQPRQLSSPPVYLGSFHPLFSHRQLASSSVMKAVIRTKLYPILPGSGSCHPRLFKQLSTSGSKEEEVASIQRNVTPSLHIACSLHKKN